MESSGENQKRPLVGNDPTNFHSSLADVESQLQPAVVVESGWLVAGWPVEDPLLDLAKKIGSPVSVRRSDPVLTRLHPTNRQDAKRNSLSAKYGVGAFPYHTDCAHHPIPPRFTLLRLASGAQSNRPTLLVSIRSLALSPRDLIRLRNSVWLVNGGRGRFLSRLLTEVDGIVRIRFDEECMRPAHPRFEQDGQILRDAVSVGPAFQMDWAEDQVLIMDNWQVLHARGPARDSEGEVRVLERVEVE